MNPQPITEIWATCPCDECKDKGLYKVIDWSRESPWDWDSPHAFMSWGGLVGGLNGLLTLDGGSVHFKQGDTLHRARCRIEIREMFTKWFDDRLAELRRS